MAKQTTTTPSRQAARRSNTARRPAGGARKVKVEESNIQWTIPFDRMNVILIFLGVAVIVIGYFLMSTAIGPDPANNQGSWNNSNAVVYAPILLVIGYCIIVPIAIMRRFKQNSDEAASTEA